ncbi:MAG TPA: HAMP domain-containing sensor histidine kinase [Nitrososphaeraceae archaeon]|nr:HAMP domain-containing sensor histidine kinase [Nitrososphaeraceae archaeon]
MHFESKVTAPIPALPPSSPSVNKSEILYGVENAVGRGVYFMANVKERMDIFFDHRAPSIVTDIAEYRNGYFEIRKRGGKIRCFTEVTEDNVHHCKELMKLVDELRHLDGVRGGMAVSESEYMATTVLQEAKPLTQVIYSNVKEVVEQGQYIFDTLWNTAIPADQKIREIEEGIIPLYTKVINEPNTIIEEIIQINESSNDMSICATAGGMQFTYSHFFEVTNRLLDRYRKGKHKGIRYISNINRENVDIAKLFLDSGIQLKHVNNLPPVSFGVSDKQIGATIEKMELGKTVQSLLISNEPLYVNHFNSIFEELWKNGIDAKSRVHDIEQGVDTEGIEIIQNPYDIQNLAFELVKSAQKEIRIIFSTSNAFHRQEYVGAMKLLKEAITQRGVKVRILTPKDDSIQQKVERLTAQQHMHARYIEPPSQTKVSILVVDDNSLLSVELRDDTKMTSYEAMGLAIFSNSKPTVLSYVSIFESLWKQADLYQQLENSNKELAAANEKLKEADKIQREFINVAAHELRTPIQPILGLSEMLQLKIKNKGERELIDVIARNAKRLHRLTEDILDVTKIESQSLNLKKETLDLNEMVMSVISEYGTHAKKNSVEMRLVSKGDFIIEGDKERLAQVLSNLVSNAYKFTKEGKIDILLQKLQDGKEVILSVKDTGSGIDSDIMPRLFTKFATRSDAGTGLGLYISKNVVETHGGKIWAENNSNGKGATFSFTLPLTQK